MRELLTVIDCSKTEGCDVPEILREQLKEIWAWSLQQSALVGGKGMRGLEQDLREKVLELGGRILEGSLSEKCGTGYVGSRPECSECGETSKFMNYRLKRITTLVKQVSLKRAYYYCGQCGQGWLPLDRMLDVEGSTWSPGVREAVCLVDAAVAFERGKEWLGKLSGIKIAAEEGRLISEGMGETLEEAVQEEIENVWEVNKPFPREVCEKPKRLYISPDGTTVHTEEGWKEMKVGAVFTARVPAEGEDPEREITRYVGGMENSKAFGKRLYVEAVKLGLGSDTEVIAIGDGAHWIWNELDVILPERRTEIIDFYHASEKLWEAAKLAYGEESPQTKTWAERQAHQLKRGKFNQVLEALQEIRVKGKEAKAVQRQIIGYFKTNRDRMRYLEFRKKGYFIGSGVVESSCKHLVGSRLKQAGMKWTQSGAQAILQLRVALLNNRWDHLWTRMAA